MTVQYLNVLLNLPGFGLYRESKSRQERRRERVLQYPRPFPRLETLFPPPLSLER